MSDFLRRNLAPLSDAAWNAVEEAARQTLTDRMTARSLVDFDGPHGLEYSAVNLGRLEIAAKPSPQGVPWGLRTVQPLAELRIPISLDQLEVDNISRGCANPDLGTVEQAAQRLAQFEESAVYNGFQEAGIAGIIPSSAHDAIDFGKTPEAHVAAVTGGIEKLRGAGVGGPYALVLGAKAYYPLMSAGKGGYPPRRNIRDLLAGPILCSDALERGVLLSTRGGDFALTVGQDIGIGYASNDRAKVELYLLESFTFRVLEPAAAIELT